MPEKLGRPPIENPKKVRLEIRLTKAEATLLQECAEALQVSKTDVINKGIQLVKAGIDEK